MQPKDGAENKAMTPYPTFKLGEGVTVKGGEFTVHAVRKGRLILKPVK